MIVSGNQTTFKFKQGWWDVGELTYDDSFTRAEGEREEPVDSYSPILAVVALVALLGLAYTLNSKSLNLFPSLA